MWRNSRHFLYVGTCKHITCIHNHERSGLQKKCPVRACAVSVHVWYRVSVQLYHAVVGACLYPVLPYWVALDLSAHSPDLGKIPIAIPTYGSSTCYDWGLGNACYVGKSCFRT